MRLLSRNLLYTALLVGLACSCTMGSGSDLNGPQESGVASGLLEVRCWEELNSKFEPAPRREAVSLEGNAGHTLDLDPPRTTSLMPAEMEAYEVLVGGHFRGLPSSIDGGWSYDASDSVLTFVYSDHSETFRAENISAATIEILDAHPDLSLAQSTAVWNAWQLCSTVMGRLFPGESDGLPE